MQSEKSEAIQSWPPCRDLTELRAFRGTCGYYRRFVENFAGIASPLYAIIRKRVRFEWTTECQEAFEELKLRLINGPILALPIDEGTYILNADASGFGLGAILSQTEFGTERVIAYSSRTLNRAEQQCETAKKELLVIMNGLKLFCQYLVRREFVIRTVHAALSWFAQRPNRCRI